MQLRLRLRPLQVVPLAAALLLAAAAPVRAAGQTAEGEQENALREKANALMASSSWAEALPIWAKLFAVDGKPVNLWNAAVCQVHLARAGQATPEEALALLEQYRDSPGLSQEKKTKVQRYIDEMTALKAQRAAAAAPVPATPPPVPVSAPPTPAPSAPVSGGEPPGRGLRAGAWTAGGVGVAALAAGAYFSIRTHSLDDKVTNEGTFSASDDSSGHLAETLQYVMYGVGAAALVTAGVLTYLGTRRSEAPSVALAPLTGPGLSGALVQVRF